jgi:hypothetical protein
MHGRLKVEHTGSRKSREKIPVGPTIGPDLEVVVGVEVEQRRLGLLHLQRLAVVLGLVLDAGNPEPHDGLQQQHGRAACVAGLIARCATQRLVDGLVIIALCHLDHVPAGGVPVGGVVLRHDVGGLPADLQAVHVDDADQVAEAELHRKAARLGDLALLLLTVAHEAVGAAVEAVHLRGERRAHGRREPLAQIAGGPLHARHVRLHVAAERRAGAAEAEQHVASGDEVVRGD